MKLEDLMVIHSLQLPIVFPCQFILSFRDICNYQQEKCQKSKGPELRQRRRIDFCPGWQVHRFWFDKIPKTIIMMNLQCWEFFAIHFVLFLFLSFCFINRKVLKRLFSQIFQYFCSIRILNRHHKKCLRTGKNILF